MTDTMWSDLTDPEKTALVTAPGRTVAAGCDLLNFDLTFAGDLTDDLVASGSDVKWDGSDVIHRDCDLTIARQLQWATALVRPYLTITDPVSGLSARANLGVFTLTEPDSPLGTEVIDPKTGARSLQYSATGQDRLTFLNRQVGYSYVIYAATGVLDALAQVFTDAGLTGVTIDSTAAAATVPTDMVWPLLTDTTSGATPDAPAVPPDVAADSSSGPTTWLQIVNELLGLITYRGVWADDNGFYRCEPYIDPAARPSSFGFDSDSVTDSTVGAQRTVSANVTADIPNQWIFVWSNMPDDPITGDPVTPTTGNGGVYVVTNQSDGPTSVDARNGLTYPTQVQITAASADDVVAQGDAQVAATKRIVATASVTTAPFPAASHFDVFAWTDAKLADDGGVWKVQATGWTVHLDGSDTEWDWEQVA